MLTSHHSILTYPSHFSSLFYSISYNSSTTTKISVFLSSILTCSSMSTVSKDDNLALSSEDSSSPDESELELGLGLSLSNHFHYHHAPPPFARIFTAKDFDSSLSPSAGTKRPAADSLLATNRPSQVVGWPPLRAYRVNSFNSHAKSTEAFNSVADKSESNNTAIRKSADNGNDNNKVNIKEKRHLKSSPFIKVSMDGIPIGRKVDLSAHSSYESLALALEDMFNESATGITCKESNEEDHGVSKGRERHSKLLDGSSKFVLTYEDREGDWMLVGDVPWGMFLSSVRRLRIMRTSEANGLAPRLEEKSSRQKSKPI